MKKHYLSLLVCFFLLWSKTVQSQCSTYSFSSLSESISVYGDPLETSVNTLGTCSEYVFKYSIGFSSGLPTVTDDITFELPLNVSFQSLISSNGTVTVISNTGNTVTLNVSGWDVSQQLDIEMLGVSSVCDVSAVTGSNITELSGAIACGSINSPNSVAMVGPNLTVDNISLPTSGSLTKNINDVDEIVFKIKNTSANGSVIQNLLVDYTLNSIVESFQNTYYLSTSSAQGTGSNSYTYTFPSSGIFSATLSPGTIGINPTDFQNILGHGYLAGNEEIYLHIPYLVNECGPSTGNFYFKRDCGNTSTCDNIHLTHNISVISGAPYIGAGNVAAIPNGNGTFCAAASDQDMSLGWKIYGSNADPTGGPSGYARVTDMELVLLVDNSFGTINPSTFTIFNGVNTISIPLSLVETVNTSFPLISTPTTGTIYKIHLDELPVVSNNWQPLGPNSLSDLDGDGFVDDLIEYGSFEVKVDYTYNTSCPLYNDHSAYYTIATLEWHYSNACGVPVANSAVGGDFTWYQDASTYGYTATGEGGELVLPPDVIAGNPFTSELCFAPYYEGYTTAGLGFDCPNGFHRVIYEIPNGYHLNTSGFTASSSNPGWFELPDVTVTSMGGNTSGTAQITPIAQEYCNPNGLGRIIEIRFGLLPWDLAFFGRPTSFLLPCFDLPMYLDCDAIDPSCPSLPNNFGFDNMNFKLEFVCDEACDTCSSFIIGADASTYHHCLGECDSYFGTDQNPMFKRSTLGYLNGSSGYLMGDDITQPSDLTSTTEPTIDLSAAYPGDQISLQVNGEFHGTPTLAYTPHTGASYDDIYLQIRYQDLLPGDRKEARLFDLEQVAGDGILITETSPLNGTSSYLVPVSDIVMTDFVLAGVVHLNLNLSSNGLAFIDEANASYTFSSNLHLRVRSEPFSSTHHYFYSTGKHVIESLRFEYKGTEDDGLTINGSCDDYGANFKILQPNTYGTNGVYIGEPTYCGLTEVSFRFYNDAALFQIDNDFSNEYRAYGQLSPELDVTIPAGYTYVSAYFFQNGKEYNPAGPNNFGPNYIPGNLIIPISGETTSTDPFGNTIVHFNGSSAINPTWPALDLDVSNGGQYINIKLLPSCEVHGNSTVYFTGDYTLGVNQELPAYQLEIPFTTLIPLGHYEPHINVINPIASANAYNGTAEFTFSVCNENLFMTGPANQAWFAFENSLVNGLDLANATLVALPGNTPVNFTTYNAGGGQQGIIVNYGLINPQACVNFKLTANVSPNGCVETNESVPDYLTVYGGNSCDGTLLTEPVEECTKDVTEFAFNRFPSGLELILPENAYPTNPVEMCNGVLEYNFVINSNLEGAIHNNKFWLDLPSGITLVDATFDYLNASPSNIVTTTAFDGNNYGPGADLDGWDLLDQLAITYLPGTLTPLNNKIHVKVRLKVNCDYDLISPILFYTDAINSCNVETETFEASTTPLISNTTGVNDIEVSSQITFSDNDSTLNCENTATVTLAIENNSSISNLTDLTVTATVPTSPFVVNPGTGTLSGNTITWTIPVSSLLSGASTTVSYTVSQPTAGYCQNDIPLAAEIEFGQNVTCTSTGGYCSVVLNAAPSLDTLDACCDSTVTCDLALSGSSTPVFCKSHLGSATVSVTGANGNVTYLWNDPQAQTTATATDLFQGTYTVIVTDENGCIDSISVTVGAQNSPLTVTAIPDQNPICEGQSVSIALDGADNYSISSGMYGSTSSGAPFVVTPSVTTTYTVNGSDQFGCYGTTTVTIEVDSIVTPLFDSIGSYCYGDSIPALPTTSLNGISGSWSPAINNTSTTTYTFTPTAGQCATTATLQIVINPIVTPTFNPVGPYCAGASIPALQNPSSNGISGSWSPAINNMTTTVYTFTPDVGECAHADTMSITILPVIEPIFKKIKTTYCVGETVSTLPTTSANGVTGTWSPAVISNTTSGTYVFTPTSPMCATTYTLNVTVNPIPASPTISSNSTICSGTTLLLTANTISGATYYWSGPLSFNSNLEDPSINPATAAMSGTYSCYVTVNGCQSSTSNTLVTVTPLPTATISGNATVCKGVGDAPEIIFTGANGSSPYTFTYNINGGANQTISSVAPSSTATISAPTGTTGTFIYNLVSVSSNGCSQNLSGTATVTINAIPSTPTITASGPLTFCAPGSVTLTSSATTGNLWSPTNAVTQSITVSTSGTYSVTQTISGCSSAASAPVTVTVKPAPVMTDPADITVCKGTSVPASNYQSTVAGTTFTWTSSNGAVGLSGTNVAGNAPGFIASNTTTNPISSTVTVVPSYNGCTGASQSYVITVNPMPAITGTLSACAGGNTSQLTGTPTGGTWWSQNGNIAATVNSSGLVTTSLTTYGSTNIYYSVNGCQTSVNFIIKQAPTISTPATSACVNGTPVQFTGSPSPGTWSSTASSIASVSSTGLVTPSTSNSGTVGITYTLSSTGCQKTQSFTVNPLPLAPSINGGATTAQICTGDYGTLSSVPYTSGIVWTPGSATTPSIVVPAPSSTTNYTVTYTHPTTGCKSSATIAVSRKNCFKPVGCTLVANFNSSVSNCNWTFTSSSTFGSTTISSPGAGYTFNWTILDANTGALVTTGSGFSFVFSGFPTSGTYTVCLTVTNTEFSPLCQDQISKNISVNCGSSMVLSTNATGLTSKFEVKGEEEAIAEADDMDYLWSFGDGTFSTDRKPEHKYAKAGTYEVCLKRGLGDLTDAPVAACRTIYVSEDETDQGIVPILSVNPNPTNGQTTILLDGAENRTVEIKLYDMLGQEVKTLFERACCNETMIRLIWNSEDVPPGVYLIKAQIDSKTITEKVVVASH